MTTYILFSDTSFLCSVKLKQLEFFVPQQAVYLNEAEHICSLSKATVVEYNNKNKISELVDKFDETKCEKVSLIFVKEKKETSTEIILIRVDYGNINLSKDYNEQLKFKVLCQRERKFNESSGNNKSSSTSNSKIEGVAIGILACVVLLVFIPSVLYAVPSIRVSLTFL